jgi:hypothetical protein
MNSENKKPFLGDAKIDFSEASIAWRQNKQRIRGGAFKYCCGTIRNCGKVCRRPPWDWKKKRNVYSLQYGGVLDWGLCTFHERQRKNVRNQR